MSYKGIQIKFINANFFIEPEFLGLLVDGYFISQEAGWLGHNASEWHSADRLDSRSSIIRGFKFHKNSVCKLMFYSCTFLPIHY